MRDTATPQTLDNRPEADGATAHSGGARRIRFGLTARFLVLFAVLVVVAEIAVYVPWIASFHDNWLRYRLSAGYSAALVFDAAPRGMISGTLSRQLLDSVPARVIVLQKNGTRRILAAGKMPSKVDETYDLRQPSYLRTIAATYRTLMAPDGRVLTILGEAPAGSEAVEITLDESLLKTAIARASRRILTVSLVTSILSAGLAVAIIHLMMLGPVRRLTKSLMHFADDPEDAARIIVPSGRNHEIGHAEAALAVMQDALARELNQKKHLAALGLAVAKINHDMRNMLASAQILSDRLADLTDPLARRLAPKLVATLDRAIRFCEATLAYGRAVDEPPKQRLVGLRGIVSEAAETAALTVRGKIAILNEVPDGFEIFADPEQMFRVLVNLIRNGAEALERAGPSPGRPARVTISASRDDTNACIEIADTGPGVPNAARAKLFSAFLNSTRPGGSGLGLAIAADLVRAHGGRIMLAPEESEENGACFRVTLPLRPGNGRG